MVWEDGGREAPSYPIELGIPLRALGLSAPELAPTPGWVAVSQDMGGEPLREYHPHSGLAMGLGVVTGGDSGLPDRADDPTTWHTLIFVADR